MLGVLVQVLHVIGEDRADLPDASCGDDLADTDHMRQIPGPHRLGDQHPGGLRCALELLGLGLIQREGFLHQGVLAVLDRQQRIGVMHGMRGGDVDDVHLSICGQLLVGAVAARDAELRCESLGGFG